MKPDLAKKLLKDIILPIVGTEDEAEKVFSELHFLGEYKYDYYEMYAPGRHFLEHFYLWIKQFKINDRKAALEIIRKHLIFISRREFEMLSDVLYYEKVRKIQFDLVSKEKNIPRYRVKKIEDSPFLKNIERSSLYVAMSDGARIDYFRRKHQNIGNEQVLASYHVDKIKCEEMIEKLEKDCGKGSKFKLLFLIDDFCGSGKTLIRNDAVGNLKGTLSQLENKKFPAAKIVDGKAIVEEPSLLETLLHEDCQIFLCPMIATQQSVNNINRYLSKLSSNLKHLIVNPVVVLNPDLSIHNKKLSHLKELCSGYYQDRMADEHTGNVKFGYDNCGLLLTLHHNTPNNSIYLIWNRRAIEADGINPSFLPLFMRIERHRSIET